MQAPAYNRSKNFLENAGASTDHGAINTELDAAGQSINGLRTNQALLQNDDGSLRANTVTLANITPTALAQLQVPGPKGDVGPVGPGVAGVQGATGPAGPSFDADARDTAANRALYDLQFKGFAMLAMDTGLLYFKLSDAAADWSAGVAYGKGDTGTTGLKGDKGDQGDRGLQGFKGDAGAKGDPGTAGLNGTVVSIDLSTKTASLIGRSNVAARLTLTAGVLSIVLTTT
jgi:hypothetical protein